MTTKIAETLRSLLGATPAQLEQVGTPKRISEMGADQLRALWDDLAIKYRSAYGIRSAKSNELRADYNAMMTEARPFLDALHGLAARVAEAAMAAGAPIEEAENRRARTYTITQAAADMLGVPELGGAKLDLKASEARAAAAYCDRAASPLFNGVRAISLTIGPYKL